MVSQYKDLFNDIPSYSRFLTVNEIDNLVDQIRKLPGVKSKIIGRTVNNESITMLEIGSSEKTAMIIGVPHSDEPMGSLVTTFFARWLANHPEKENFGWRWLIIPILERRGMRLNEGWFLMPDSLAAMAKSNFREPTEDQYEWTFPIQLDDYEWTKSRPETLAIKNIMEKERPELLCGLHHCGFNKAYFYLSSDFPEVYPRLKKLSSSVRMPLADSSPDVPFGKSFHPGFYKMYGLKEYLEYYKKKDPVLMQTLKRGACSDEWYQQEVGGFSFNCEVPLYLSSKLQDNRQSEKNFHDILVEQLNRKHARVDYSKKFLKKLQQFANLSDPLLYEAAEKHIKNAQNSIDHEKRILGKKINKKITNAEVFENEVLADLFDLFFLGQIWRVAESICIKGGAPKICRLMETADLEIKSLGKSVQDRGIFYQLPIRNSVKMQVGSILIIADELSKKLN